MRALKAFAVVSIAGACGFGLGTIFAERTTRPVAPFELNARSIHQSLDMIAGKDLQRSPVVGHEEHLPSTATDQSIFDRHVIRGITRTDPIAAVRWILNAPDLSATDRLTMLRVFAKEMNAERTEQRFHERLAWTGAMDQAFALSSRWRMDEGETLRAEIADHPRAIDTIWVIADSNPAGSWSDMAEWVSTVNAPSSEKARLIEHLVRREVAAGNRDGAAVMLMAKSDPLFDRAKLLLVSGAGASSNEFGQGIWNSLSSDDARLCAAAEALASEQFDFAANASLLEWASGSVMGSRLQKIFAGNTPRF